MGQRLQKPLGAEKVIRRVRDYELLEEIGSGVVGVVWRAHSRKTLQYVAIKEIVLENEQKEQYFQRRAALQQKLKHVHIVSIIEYFIENDGRNNLYVVMELCDTDLYRIFKSNQRFPVEQITSWFLQLLEVIAYYNEKEIVHRNIKLQNILIKWRTGSEQFDVKISDFLIPTPGDTNELAGYSPYTAPELIDEKSSAGAVGDSRVDIWALGLVFLQAVVGLDPQILEAIVQSVVYYSTEETDSLIEKYVTEPAVRVLLRRMVCRQELRARAVELLRDPIVMGWRALLTINKGALYSMVSADHRTLYALATGLAAKTNYQLPELCITVLGELTDFTPAHTLLESFHDMQLEPALVRAVVTLTALYGKQHTNGAVLGRGLKLLQKLLMGCVSEAKRPLAVNALIRSGLTVSLFLELMDIDTVAATETVGTLVEYSRVLGSAWAPILFPKFLASRPFDSLNTAHAENPIMRSADAHGLGFSFFVSTAHAIPRGLLSSLLSLSHLTDSEKITILGGIATAAARAATSGLVLPWLVGVIQSHVAENRKVPLSALTLLWCYIEDVDVATKAVAALQVCIRAATGYHRDVQLPAPHASYFWVFPDLGNQQAEPRKCVMVCSACARVCRRHARVWPVFREHISLAQCECHTLSDELHSCCFTEKTPTNPEWNYLESPSCTVTEVFRERNALSYQWDEHMLEAAGVSQSVLAYGQLSYTVPTKKIAAAKQPRQTNFAVVRTTLPFCSIANRMRAKTVEERFFDPANQQRVSRCTIAYFEMTVIDGPEDNAMFIGVALESATLHSLMAGNLESTIVYQSEDGTVACNLENTPSSMFSFPATDGTPVSLHFKLPHGPIYSSGDTVGCGVTADGYLFFTKNGCLVAGVFDQVKLGSGNIYPLVGFSLLATYTSLITVSTNFGTKPFEFEFDRDISAVQSALSEPTIVSGAMRTLNAFDVPKMISEMSSFHAASSPEGFICRRLQRCIERCEPLEEESIIVTTKFYTVDPLATISELRRGRSETSADFDNAKQPLSLPRALVQLQQKAAAFGSSVDTFVPQVHPPSAATATQRTFAEPTAAAAALPLVATMAERAPLPLNTAATTAPLSDVGGKMIPAVIVQQKLREVEQELADAARRREFEKCLELKRLETMLKQFLAAAVVVGSPPPTTTAMIESTTALPEFEAPPHANPSPVSHANPIAAEYSAVPPSFGQTDFMNLYTGFL